MAAKKFRYVFEPMVPKELLDPADWAVEGLMPLTGITCLFGKPGSFKTFEAIAIAACKATGLLFCGRWTGPPCKVGYIAADAPKGVKLRARAWFQAHQDLLDEQDIDEDILDANLMVLPIPVNLYKPNEVADAIIELQTQGFKCEVLIVDTLFHSSIGANLTKPEELLPLFEQLTLLMAAVGAKACLLVHHTTKDGEEFFGSVTFMASLEAMIKSEWKDETTARVSCARMRENPFFGAFEINFTKEKVKTKPNRRGIDEFEFLVVGSGAPAEKRSTKAERNLETMEFVLDFHLGNKATFTEWFEKVHEFTSKKEKGKVVKEGWSETTFRRVLKMLKDQGRVIVTAGQGEYYSLVYSEQAKRARSGVQPGGPGEPAEPPSAGSTSLTGKWRKWRWFWGPATTAKPPPKPKWR
jgi:hypothetical protein